eukprot:TRINITY_DN31329_c0_g1_i2.p1 TRINITY_DN31329_c0_g1~~TRINITY_DN31329_c0_g1_i2.p1  ORF type:complete len:229 (+),score=80.16 TRINITY_DN31329_c0_g1_i2:352-1038(+)
MAVLLKSSKQRETAAVEAVEAMRADLAQVKQQTNEDLLQAQNKLLIMQAKMKDLQSRVTEASALQEQQPSLEERTSPVAPTDKFREAVREAGLCAESSEATRKSTVIQDLLAQEDQMIKLLTEQETVRRFISSASGTDIDGVSPDRWSPLLRSHDDKLMLEAQVDQLTKALHAERSNGQLLASRCAALEQQAHDLTMAIEARAKFPSSPPPLLDSSSGSLSYLSLIHI